MTKKVLWVFAGPNGSGKSTIIERYFAKRLPIVNPDDIAKELNPFRRNEPDIVMQAGRIAIKRRKEHLQNDVSFAFETTLSGNSESHFIEDAIAAGYQVNIVYVATDDSLINVTRVSQRVLKGGHAVPQEDILRRYKRSMENLTLLLKKVYRLIIIDNSANTYHLCAVIAGGRLKSARKVLPDWVAGVLSSIGGTNEKSL